MSWSFPIARLFGSQIRIHVTFLLLLAWIGISHYQQGGPPAAFEGVAFILALFACVIAHEFGHALAARRYGIRTPDITLLPIGGLARLERMPEKSGQEIVVALAGPAVNVVIAVVLFVIMNARFDIDALQRLDNPALGFMARLFSVNIFLVLFNLIPAF
nr:M50 family metallopeptidase [Hyphomicrobiales bacterium]